MSNFLFLRFLIILTSLNLKLISFRVESGELATDLLKRQNKTLSLQNVQKGISYFKENRNQDAKVSYNKALSIDEENVEAYVARGALYLINLLIQKVHTKNNNYFC